MTIASDTGPLIALAKIDQLPLLQKLFTEVLVPLAVQSELLAKRGPETANLEAFMQEGGIRTVPLSPIPAQVRLITRRLGEGEQQAIALAHEKNALLLIDEHLGRFAARKLELAVTGVVGVLIKAKRMGQLEYVLPLLQSLRLRGYWLSEAVLAAAAAQSGEHV